MCVKDESAKWLGELIVKRGLLNKAGGFFNEAIHDGVPKFEPPHAVYEYIAGEAETRRDPDSEEDVVVQARLFRLCT